MPSRQVPWKELPVVDDLEADPQYPTATWDDSETQLQNSVSEGRLQALFNMQHETATTADSVTIVIPTLDEEQGVGRLMDELRENGFSTVLVVDGYSHDSTATVAASKGARVVMQHGLGKAGALQTAFENVETPYILVMDGDDSYAPSDIHILTAYAPRYDMVIGARHDGRGNIPALNRFGNWAINTVFKLLFAKPITDVCSGMYLLRTEFARRLEITTTSFDVEVEIACQAAANGRITEVPISYRKRVGKQKLKSFGDGLRIFRTLWWMASYYNPVVLYGAVMGLAVVPGAAILLWVLYQDMALHVWHAGYALFSVMFLLLASQGAAVATMSLLMKRMEIRLREELQR